MSLRTLAEQDLALTLEDSAGFGWPVTLTAPDGTTSSGLFCQSADINQAIDPETGLLVSSRKATAVFRTSTLEAAGLSNPKGVQDTVGPPWRVIFEDINGTSYTFAIRYADPDKTIGLVVCFLEAYTP